MTLPRLVFRPHTSNECTFPRHSEREWQELISFAGWHCFYCQSLLQPGAKVFEKACATKDHLIPISRGGCDCVGNLVPSCLACNQLKSYRTLSDFIRWRPGLVNLKFSIPTRVLVSSSALFDSSMRELVRAKSLTEVVNWKEDAWYLNRRETLDEQAKVLHAQHAVKLVATEAAALEEAGQMRFSWAPLRIPYASQRDIPVELRRRGV